MSSPFFQYRSVSENDFFVNKKICNGVPILDVSSDRLLDILRTAQPGNAEYMVTPNVDHLRLLDELGGRFLDAYENSALIVCDSRVLKIVSKIVPGDIISHVNPGSDITKNLFGCSWFRQSKVAVIGSSQGDIDKIKDQYGFLDLSLHAPPMGFIHNEAAVQECVDFVRKIDPDYLLIAVGCPQGELLAYRIFCDLRQNVQKLKFSLCIGASIDFIAGKQKRAPTIFQNIGMEWLYRLATNFSRLKTRYYRDLVWLCGYIIKCYGGKRREV